MLVGPGVFLGERLQLAREFRGMTQRQLADAVVASHSLISQYEANRKGEPSSDLLEALGDVLGFEPAFFYQPLMETDDQCSFRRRRTTTERLKTQVRAHAALLAMVVERLRSVFNFPDYNVPKIRCCSTAEEIDSAAERCRCHWNISLDSPIFEIGRVLEHAGVLVMANMAQSKKIDAFSRYGTTAMIFLNQSVPSTSRWIFDLAHECGHLVMHPGMETGTVETEKAADRFASALMMPRRAFGREFRSASFTWEHAFELKRRWRVSVAAIVTRAYLLGLLDAVEYRRAYQYISAHGWRSGGEPYEPAFQGPELFALAMEGLGTQVPLTVEALRAELFFTAQTFADVTGTQVPPTKANLNVIPFSA